MFEALEGVEPKQYLTLLSKVMSMHIIGLAALACAVVYGVNEYVVAPKSNEMQQLDTAKKNLDEELQKSLSAKQQFESWEETLKGLNTQILVLDPDGAPQIAAAKEVDRIIQEVNETSETLPEPHGTRKFLAVKDNGNTFVNIMDSGQDPQQPLGGAPVGANPAAGTPPVGNPAAGETPGNTNAPGQVVNLFRYRYDLEVEGTYVALADLINRMIQSPNLVVIDQVEIKPSESRATVGRGNMVLTMVCSFSIYIYDPAHP